MKVWGQVLPWPVGMEENNIYGVKGFGGWNPLSVRAAGLGSQGTFGTCSPLAWRGWDSPVSLSAPLGTFWGRSRILAGDCSPLGGRSCSGSHAELPAAPCASHPPRGSGEWGTRGGEQQLWGAGRGAWLVGKGVQGNSALRELCGKL